MSTTTKWHRSSRCSVGACIEVAALDDGVIAVRDSKNLDQAPLVFSREDWIRFLDEIRAGGDA